MGIIMGTTEITAGHLLPASWSSLFIPCAENAELRVEVDGEDRSARHSIIEPNLDSETVSLAILSHPSKFTRGHLHAKIKNLW